MLGSAFAGTLETPGEIVHKPVVLPEGQRTVLRVPFKVLRGMASIGAIKDRLDVEDAAEVDLDAIGAEGLETSVPARGSVRPVIRTCSSISARPSVTAAPRVSRTCDGRSGATPIATSSDSQRPRGGESYDRS